MEEQIPRALSIRRRSSNVEADSWERVVLIKKKEPFVRLESGLTDFVCACTITVNKVHRTKGFKLYSAMEEVLVCCR